MSLDTVTCYGWFDGSEERHTQVATYGWYDPGIILIGPSPVLVADVFQLGRVVALTFDGCEDC